MPSRPIRVIKSSSQLLSLVGAERGRTHPISAHRSGTKSLKSRMLRHIMRQVRTNYFASVLVLRLRSAPFYGITHIVEYKDCDGRHALPLFGTKRFVQWLPRLGESIQIG